MGDVRRVREAHDPRPAGDRRRPEPGREPVPLHGAGVRRRRWEVPLPTRVYDPSTGRFQQRDPAGYVDGPSAYEYTTSAPCTAVDPLGLETRDPKVQALLAARAKLNAAYKAYTRASDALEKAKEEAAAAQKAYDIALSAWKAACKKRRCSDVGPLVRGRDSELDDLWDALQKAKEDRDAANRAASAAQTAYDEAAAAYDAALATFNAARNDLNGSGVKPTRQDILDMVRQDLLDFGPKWVHDAMENGLMTLAPDSDPVFLVEGKHAMGAYSDGVMWIPYSSVDNAVTTWEHWGESDLLETLLHEGRHYAEEHEDGRSGHPADSERDAPRGGQSGWHDADQSSGLGIEQIVHRAQRGR